jgi:hypothetical protein
MTKRTALLVAVAAASALSLLIPPPPHGTSIPVHQDPALAPGQTEGSGEGNPGNHLPKTYASGLYTGN